MHHSTTSSMRGLGAEDICQRFRDCSGLEFIILIQDEHGWIGDSSEFVAAVALLHELCSGGAGYYHAVADLQRRLTREADRRRVSLARVIHDAVKQLDSMNVRFALAARDPVSLSPRLFHSRATTSEHAEYELARYLRDLMFAEMGLVRALD